MTEGKNYSGQLVFGLDIGTRSIVGTVGYRSNNRFYVVAQRVKEHETRAMLDGQIHDIRKVGETVSQVKGELEKAIGRNLTEVCIAAAGRVLRTVNVTVDTGFDYDKEMTQEDMYSLASLGVEKAYEMFQDENDTDMKFYCVGYSVIHYYINHYPISNPEGHKARVLGAEMIATFLPDDVVDGLNKAVELAGLNVVNMTLEPIAAIQVAIPEMYRMLNIALVDVGAGTSDISITKDGSIVAFGMIPIAGDVLTETIAKHCLVDFGTAEQIKKDAGMMEEITFKDIMGLQQSIAKDELLEVLKPVIDSMTLQVADKIKELNGGKSVSAVFVVGGGGKIEGYTDSLADQLGIQQERVAVRGGEVMQSIDFLEENIVKDSLLVTPIGICLSFYEQSNNFIFVDFNGQRVKLYDNNMLAVVDAAMQAEFEKEGLFPKRGKELNFTVNGKARIVRGQLGEAAVIRVNGEEADIHTPIRGGDRIEVIPSTAGADAAVELGALNEFGGVIRVTVNDKKIDLPKFARVNGQLQSGYYDIRNNDIIEMLNYYTVKQIADFMDVMVDNRLRMYVNNKLADMDTYVYENFTVSWTMKETDADTWAAARERVEMAGDNGQEDWEPEAMEEEAFDDVEDLESGTVWDDVPEPEWEYGRTENKERKTAESTTAEGMAAVGKPQEKITVLVNGRPVTMEGKASYVFVDVFDYIDFDLSTPKGSCVVTKRNGSKARHMEEIQNGDVIEVYWEK
ncbi:MAG TPA: cell division protein FtsA [Lachnospiraceae bacterium]|nr:cell division protein FtsA [Lachnospiraceae bacterium]